MPPVFISYAREDEPFVRRLHDALTARRHDVWVDWEGIRPSEEWMLRVQSGIEAARAFIFILSPDSAVSGVCRKELDHAVEQHKRLIPVICRETDPELIPEPLRRVHWISFTTGDFERSLATLGEAIDTDLDWVNAHTNLLVKAREWEAKRRNDSLLLRGPELTAAETWLAAAAAHAATPPTALHTEYILAGRKGATRRLRRLAVAAGLTLLVIGVASGLAYQARGREKLERIAKEKAEEARQTAEHNEKLQKELTKKARIAEQTAKQLAALEAELKQEQEALRLVAEASRLLYRQPDQALMLAQAARQLAPRPAAREAASATLQSALNVLRVRRDIQKRETVQWGSGEIYIAPNWFQGKLSARLSPDGRRVIMTTERGKSGATPPGDAFILDYETLKLARLEPPSREHRLTRRLEYTGFSSSGRKIYLSRHYNIEVYSVDGTFERQFIEGMVGTKFPIHLVEGIEGDRLILFADGDGQLAAFEPDRRRSTTISRISGVPVTELRVSPSGRWVAAIRKNGRVSLWPVSKLRFGSRVELPEEGVLTAAFKPSREEDLLLLAGRRGKASIWSLTGPRPRRLHSFSDGKTAVGYARFLEDGQRVLTIGDDQIGRIWDGRTGELVATVASDREVDWVALRGSRKAVLEPPSFAAGDPERLELPSSDLRVRDVRDVGGRTWLLTLRKENRRYGPAYLVQGNQALAFPTSEAGVFEVTGSAKETWLLTYADGYGPAYRVRGDEVRLFPTDKAGVTSVFVDGADVWLATTGGGFRLRGEEIVRYTDSTVAVHQIQSIDGTIWLATDDGAFRIDNDIAMQVTDVALNVREIVQAGGAIWIRTGPAEQGDSSGPIYRVTGNRAVAVPDDQTGVEVIQELRGTLWLGTSKGLYRVRGRAAVPVRGCPHSIVSIEEHHGAVWALTKNGILSGPVCRVEGDGAAQAFAVPGMFASDKVSLVEAGGSIWILTPGWPCVPGGRRWTGSPPSGGRAGVARGAGRRHGVAPGEDRRLPDGRRGAGAGLGRRCGPAGCGGRRHDDLAGHGPRCLPDRCGGRRPRRAPRPGSPRGRRRPGQDLADVRWSLPTRPCLPGRRRNRAPGAARRCRRSHNPRRRWTGVASHR